MGRFCYKASKHLEVQQAVIYVGDIHTCMSLGGLVLHAFLVDGMHALGRSATKSWLEQLSMSSQRKRKQ